MVQIKVGDTVRLKPGVYHDCPEGRDNNQEAKVRNLLSRGGIHLEQDLHGCRWWNIEDLEVVDNRCKCRNCQPELRA